jgi:tRNA(adenine34) deaminase
LPRKRLKHITLNPSKIKDVIDLFSDDRFMKEALKEAEKAFAADEVPVGAIVVCQNRIIARAHNLTERLNDVTAHAEMQAITAASNYLGAKYLKDCTLYVTLEPCSMCAGALFWSQVGKVVFGAADLKRGFIENGGKLHPKTEIVQGVLEQECASLLTEFFRKKRGI